jgi:hypothetical protein
MKSLLSTLTNRSTKFIESFIQKITAKYDYGFVYSYTVSGQNGNGTLELTPSDPKKSPGLSNVIIMYDNPATKITVKKGASCCVIFKNGDPSQPRAFGFERGDYELLEFGDDGFGLARQGDLVMSGGATTVAYIIPYPAGAPPFNPVTGSGMCLISFGSIVVPPLIPTPILAGPLPGYITTCSTKAKAK